MRADRLVSLLMLLQTRPRWTVGKLSRRLHVDLATFWKEWCAKFAERRAQYEVTLRITPEGEEALRHIRPPADQARLSEVRLSRDGTKKLTLDFERETIALSQLCSLGRAVEVLAPEGLRTRLRSMAADLRAIYGPA